MNKAASPCKAVIPFLFWHTTALPKDLPCSRVNRTIQRRAVYHRVITLRTETIKNRFRGGQKMSAVDRTSFKYLYIYYIL